MAVVAALMSTVSVVPQVPGVSMVSEVPVVSMVPQVPAVSMVSEVPAVSMVPQVMHTCTLALYQGLLPRSLGPRLIYACTDTSTYPPSPHPHIHTHFFISFTVFCDMEYNSVDIEQLKKYSEFSRTTKTSY